MAVQLMANKGITSKFTIGDLRDNITQFQCGVRSQCRRFYQLDRDLNWTGKLVGLKVPVVYLSVFPDHIRLPLAQSEFTLV